MFCLMVIIIILMLRLYTFSRPHIVDFSSRGKYGDNDGLQIKAGFFVLEVKEHTHG